MNTESPYDSLTITDDYNHHYVFYGTTTGNMRLYGYVHFNFISNGANTQAGFQIRWNKIFSATGNAGYDSTQLSGWYFNSNKIYMRGGLNQNNAWSPDSSGNYSIAFGRFTKAKGMSSVALGESVVAGADYSVAIGNFAQATGIGAVALGSGQAIGGYSFAIGPSTAAGNYSFVSGSQNYASGNSSWASGYQCLANADFSVAEGYLSSANGYMSRAIGYSCYTSGNYSSATGSSTNAIGLYSSASGYFSNANGDFSIATGNSTNALGKLTSTFGDGTRARIYASFVVGTFNDSVATGSSTFINPANRIFQVGNGNADNARSNAMTVLQSGNVGIGTVLPVAKLHVNNGALLLDGTTGNTQVSGAGTRMMWIPSKAAFRAGAVASTEWDNANIGSYSFAAGQNVIASGINSVSLGTTNTSSGGSSVTVGSNNTASGGNSIAIGNLCSATNSSYSFGSSASASNTAAMAIGVNVTASGNTSLAMGYFTNATGTVATTLGYATYASGTYSMATGYNTTASGSYAIANGGLTYATGDYSSADGLFNRSKSFAGFVAGCYNDSANAADPLNFNTSNRLFQIGNGTADNARSNAMTVLGNGNTGLGIVAPDLNLVVNKDIRLDGSNTNNGTISSSLRFGASNTGEFIASKRTAGGNQFGLDLYTSGINRFSITNSGAVQVVSDLTVQSGKGIIRNTDGTQSKKLSASVTVNASFTAGQTQSFAITWPETFSSAPEAYVGNVTSGAGGWAEVVMSIFGTSTSGATLYVYNPKATSVSPNFTVKIIAIGPQ